MRVTTGVAAGMDPMGRADSVRAVSAVIARFDAQLVPIWARQPSSLNHSPPIC